MHRIMKLSDQSTLKISLLVVILRMNKQFARLENKEFLNKKYQICWKFC